MTSKRMRHTKQIALTALFVAVVALMPARQANASAGSQPLGPNTCRDAKRLATSPKLSRLIRAFKAESVTFIDYSMTPIGPGYNIMLLKQKGNRTYEKFFWVTESGAYSPSNEGQAIFDYFYGSSGDWMIAKVKLTTNRHTYAYCDYDTLWNLYGGD